MQRCVRCTRKPVSEAPSGRKSPRCATRRTVERQAGSVLGDAGDAGRRLRAERRDRCPPVGHDRRGDRAPFVGLRSHGPGLVHRSFRLRPPQVRSAQGCIRVHLSFTNLRSFVHPGRLRRARRTSSRAHRLTSSEPEEGAIRNSTMSRWMKILALPLAAALIMGACSSEDEATDGGSDGGSDAVTGTVNVSGSSTVAPISTRVAELWETSGSEATVNVDGPGTGDGSHCSARARPTSPTHPVRSKTKRQRPARRTVWSTSSSRWRSMASR